MKNTQKGSVMVLIIIGILLITLTAMYYFSMPKVEVSKLSENVVAPSSKPVFSGDWVWRTNEGTSHEDSFGLYLKQVGNQISGSYNAAINGGFQTDGASDVKNITGTVAGNIATITFHDDFSGVQVRGTLTYENNLLHWQITKPLQKDVMAGNIGAFILPFKADLKSEIKQDIINASADITSDEIYNGDYYTVNAQSGAFDVKATFTKNYATDGFDIPAYTFGNLTSDKFKDAAVLVTDESGSLKETTIFAVINAAGKILRLPCDASTGAGLLQIKNHQIIFKSTTPYSEGSKPYTYTFNVKNNQCISQE